jgi:hypothetical protein
MMRMTLQLSAAEERPLPDGDYRVNLRLFRQATERTIWAGARPGAKLRLSEAAEQPIWEGALSAATVRSGSLSTRLEIDPMEVVGEEPLSIEVELHPGVTASGSVAVEPAVGDQTGIGVLTASVTFGELTAPNEAAEGAVASAAPTLPVLVGEPAGVRLVPDRIAWRFEPFGDPPRRIAGVATAAGPYSVAVDGGVAYVASKGDGGLQLVDVSDPRAPDALGAVRVTGSASETDTTSSPEHVVAGNGLVLVSTYSGSNATLARVDAEDPKRPAIDSSTGVEGILTSRIGLRGRYAYLSGIGLPVIDVRDMQVHVVGRAESPFRAGDLRHVIWDIAVAGEVLYGATGRSGLAVFDLSSPTRPRLVRVVPFALEGASRIAVSGEVLVANATEEVLQLMSLTEPSRPVPLGTVDAGGEVYGLATTRRHALVTCRGTGLLQMFDLGDPGRARLISEVELPNRGRSAVATDGRCAYVTLPASDRLEIYDLSHTLGF